MASLVSSFGALRMSRNVCCCHRQFHYSFLAFSSDRRPLPLAASSSMPSSYHSPAALFSTTTPRQSLKRRRKMREWLKTRGAEFLSAERPDDSGEPSQRAPILHPFPENPFFQSQAVLGEDTRELVWDRVVRRGESVKAVAAELGIDMRRVAAVVRLKQVEKSWIAEGKFLAKPYAKAVLSMLPQTNYGPHDAVQPHEPINEIHVHGYTMQQLFVPVSESRHFTREDAAHAFHPTMLPADKRMPIPELITLERDVLTGERSPAASFKAFRDKATAQQKALAKREQETAAAEHARTARVNTARFQFRIRDINAEDGGRDGRSARAVGWRYGVPFHDRKRGQIKIPTNVD